MSEDSDNPVEERQDRFKELYPVVPSDIVNTFYHLKWCSYGKFPWWPCIVIDPSVTTIPHVVRWWKVVEPKLRANDTSTAKVRNSMNKVFVLFLGTRDCAHVDFNWRIVEWEEQPEEKKRCINVNGKKISKPNKFDLALTEADALTNVTPSEHLRIVEDYICPLPAVPAPPKPKPKPKKKQGMSKSPSPSTKRSNSSSGEPKKRQKVSLKDIHEDKSLRLRATARLVRDIHSLHAEEEENVSAASACVVLQNYNIGMVPFLNEELRKLLLQWKDKFGDDADFRAQYILLTRRIQEAQKGLLAPQASNGGGGALGRGDKAQPWPSSVVAPGSEENGSGEAPRGLSSRRLLARKLIYESLTTVPEALKCSDSKLLEAVERIETHAFNCATKKPSKRADAMWAKYKVHVRQELMEIKNIVNEAVVSAWEELFDHVSPSK